MRRLRSNGSVKLSATHLRPDTLDGHFRPLRQRLIHHAKALREAPECGDLLSAQKSSVFPTAVVSTATAALILAVAGF